MTTWRSAPEPEPVPIKAMGWVRVGLRGVGLGTLVFGGLFLLLVLRLIEYPIWRHRRPWTPYITQWVCRGAFVILGIRFKSRGQAMSEHGAIAANHSSWLDIFALNARQCVYFVSKSEVAHWPGIGWLARATGTVFIAREPKQAATQRHVLERRLKAGHKLVFFPEGTSSDGAQVLPFKSSLYAAFFSQELRNVTAIQPATVFYQPPEGEAASFYGWWGDMGFAPHLLKILSARRQGAVIVTYHAPLKVGDFPDRKSLAKASEDSVRSGLNAGAGPL